VARACPVEEIPVQAPWSFGPIPPGELRAPSYAESVSIGVDWACDWINAHPHRTFLLGGYSQGGEAASRVYAELGRGGRLEHAAPYFVAGYVFGNPSRHIEHTFYGGPPRDGEGIASYRLPRMDDNWCSLVEPGDIYGGVPTSLAGEIMRDVYTLCTDLQIHDRDQFAVDLVANMIELIGNLDGDAYDAVSYGVRQHNIDLSGANILPGEKLRAEGERLLSVRGIAAAIHAAILGLQFLCQSPPTAPHIEYHLREVFPGQTYVGLAIQHVTDWAARRAPTQ
jgi:hypothetical protein